MTPVANLHVIILAAGHGKRIGPNFLKVLLPIGGMAMVDHVIHTAQKLSPTSITVVVSHPDIEDHLSGQSVETVLQKNPQGTGHALAIATRSKTYTSDDVILLLYGDTPLVDSGTLDTLIQHHQTTLNNLTLMAMVMDNPTGYGRLIQNNTGHITKIVEEKDATPQERTIKLCNAGIMVGQANLMKQLSQDLTPSPHTGEYYATDVVDAMTKSGHTVGHFLGDPQIMAGANTLNEWQILESIFQKRKRDHFILHGVMMTDPESVFFSAQTTIDAGAKIDPHVHFHGSCHIGSGAHIRSFSVIESSSIHAGAIIGPFAHLRPGSIIDENAKIGNFVEIKNSHIGHGAKVSHLSYIGDATVGNHANIGAGAVTCNFDGIKKYKTSIGQGAFIGSNVALIAPLTVGNHAYIAAGSTIQTSIPDGALGISRTRDVSIIKRWRQLTSTKERP